MDVWKVFFKNFKFVHKLRELLETRGYKDVPRDDTHDCNFELGDDQGLISERFGFLMPRDYDKFRI